MVLISTILAALIPVVIIILLGGFLRRWDTIPPMVDPVLTRLIIRIFYPCLLFGVLYGNDALRDLQLVLIAPLCGFLIVILGYGMGLLIGRLYSGEWGRTARALSLTVGVFNYGYFAIPLSLALFGPEVTGVLVVFNLGVEIAFWTIGSLLASGSIQKGIAKNVLNPPVVAVFAGLLTNAFVPILHLPDFLLTAIRLLGQISIPLALILIGATLYDLTRNPSWWKNWQIPSLAIFLRLGILPTVVFLIAWLLPLPATLLAVITIQAGLPSGIFPIILLKLHGGDTLTGLRVVISTTLVGVVLSPIWIATGGTLLGVFE